MRKKKYKRVSKIYHVNVNPETYDAYLNFKILRPDIKTKQDFMEYANEFFEYEYKEIFELDYVDLEMREKNFIYKFPYQYHKYEEAKIQDYIDRINRRWGLNINKQEYFRRIILYTLYKYGLYNLSERKAHTDIIGDDFIEDNENISEDLKQLILELRDELKDDETLAVENEDDKTLDLENIDDYSLDIENENTINNDN